jgi:hypothetical protein
MHQYESKNRALRGIRFKLDKQGNIQAITTEWWHQKTTKAKKS